MVLCTLHLAQVSTILSTAITSTTVKWHLKTASSAPLNYEQLDLMLDMRGLEVQHIKDTL